VEETDALTVATVGLAIATVGLVVVSLLVWWEARRLRVEAVMVATAVPWEVAGGLYLAILLDNAGPAVARDVEVRWTLNRNVDAASGTLREPLFVPGFRRTILPIRGGTTMDQLAAEGASVHVELEWRDWRRGKQTQVLDTTIEAVRAAVAESGALPRMSMIEVLDQIRDQLKEIAK
jgi:hypothetical protein